MKIIKKILLWNEDYSVTENIMLICYRVFTWLFPCGLLVWNLIIDKLIDKNVSVVARIGCGGLFLLIALIIVAVIMLKKHFDKTIEQLNDKLLDCTDDEKKRELLAKKKDVKKQREIFKNACLLAPFIIVLVAVNLLENGLVTFRGTLMTIVLSMCAGFGFNCVAQSLISKNK